MTDVVKQIEAYYAALDDIVERKNDALKVSVLNERRELTNHDRSILDDVEMLLSHEVSREHAVKLLTCAIASVGKQALEHTWVEA